MSASGTGHPAMYGGISRWTVMLSITWSTSGQRTQAPGGACAPIGPTASSASRALSNMPARSLASARPRLVATTLPWSTRTTSAFLAHVNTSRSLGNSAELRVLNTRSPIRGSITSPVPSKVTSSRASAKFRFPFGVSRRPAPANLASLANIPRAGAAAFDALMTSSGGSTTGGSDRRSGATSGPLMPRALSGGMTSRSLSCALPSG